MLDVSLFLDGLDGAAMLLGPDGQTVAIPEEAFAVLRDVVSAMREGKAITVAPVDQMLTTQQAAGLLGISRPTLIKLLEDGRIPFELTTGGRHRRIRLHDVLTYQARRRSERREILDGLTAEASMTDLAEMSVEDYRDALRAARRAVSTSSSAQST